MSDNRGRGGFEDSVYLNESCDTATSQTYYEEKKSDKREYLVSFFPLSILVTLFRRILAHLIFLVDTLYLCFFPKNSGILTYEGYS